ncbi:DNA/RNA nuclease SfsA [Fibrobacterota bacterium]
MRPELLSSFNIPVSEGTLLKRYQRFLTDVNVPSLALPLTVHCPNTGSMMGLDTPGSRVLISYSGNEKRKYPYTLECVKSGRSWVCVNTLRANQLAGMMLEQHMIAGLGGYARIEPEPRYRKDTRFDFFLRPNGSGGMGAYVEVKSVTLALGGGLAGFPDSVTERGRKHLRMLMSATAEGFQAVLLFICFRSDCGKVAAAAHIDPEYASLLEMAWKKGVRVLAIKVRVTKRGFWKPDGLMKVEL